MRVRVGRAEPFCRLWGGGAARRTWYIITCIVPPWVIFVSVSLSPLSLVGVFVMKEVFFSEGMLILQVGTFR